MKAAKILFLLVFVMAASSSFGQQLVFTFINPAFGGSPLNGSWLLQSAQVQSDYQQKNANGADGNSTSELDDFANNLNNQILYSLANAIIQKQFGDLNNGLKEGQYNVGKFRINIGSGSNGLTVTVFDNTTGNQTQVIIPNY